MKTIKMAIYIMLALFLSGMASCGSEDSINPMPELGNPPFDLFFAGDLLDFSNLMATSAASRGQ